MLTTHYTLRERGPFITPSVDQIHILIVDDSRDIQNLLGKFLRDEGYRVSSAENGVEALKCLQELDSLPDLILLDLMMPVMDGFEFRLAQAKDLRISKIPVVIMTAGADANMGSVKAGAQGFITKPFSDLDLLLSTVSAAVRV